MARNQPLPLSCHTRACQVLPLVSQGLTLFADSLSLPSDGVFRVIVVNLTLLGSNHGQCMTDLARILGDMISAAPERTCAIVLHPNVCSKGHVGCTPESVQAACRKVEDALNDGAHQLICRIFGLQFSESDMYSTQRPLQHMGVMCLSDIRRQVTLGNGSVSMELISDFRASSLWTRQCVPGVLGVRPRVKFVNPLDMDGVELGMANARLSGPQEFKQHVTGEPLWASVSQPCIERFQASGRHGSCVRDLLQRGLKLAPPSLAWPARCCKACSATLGSLPSMRRASSTWCRTTGACRKPRSTSQLIPAQRCPNLGVCR